jgi:DNA-binding NarL/FixJ family response regulator
MIELLRLLLAALIDVLRGRQRLLLENLLLRQRTRRADQRRPVGRGRHAYLSPKVTRRVVDQFAGAAGVPDPDAVRRVTPLSGREREILVLIAEGLPNGVIAQRLYMTEATIRTYVSRILTKLVRDKRVQAAILAHNAGLLRPDHTSRR